MYRSLALKLGSNISRPLCLHSYMPVHIMTRKSMDKKQMFVSSHQLLQKKKELLIPIKDLSQEIGEGKHDLDVTKWVTSAKDFCEKLDLSHEQFTKMYSLSPLLKYVETIEHLSEIADVLNEYSYYPGTLKLMMNNVNRFCLTSVESLRSALEEHGRYSLEEVHQSSNVQQPEGMNQKLQYPLTAKAMEYSFKDKAVPKNHFPWEKIREQSESNKNIAECLGHEMGLDQRVVSSIWRHTLKDNIHFWNRRAKVVLLQKEGFENHDIFENLAHVRKITVNRLHKTIEENKKAGGRKVLEYDPKVSRKWMTSTLLRLFKCTINDFKRKEIEFFYGKSKTNVATVFFLLLDEGFYMEEIRKYIHLLGVPENEIRHYLKSNSLRSLMIENERWKLLRKMHEDLVLAHQSQGELKL